MLRAVAPAGRGPDEGVRYADNSGVKLAYQVHGSGPRTIVLTPGFVWHLDLVWEEAATARFLRRLASFGRLVLWDRREQGLSDRTGAPATLEEGAEDLRAVLDASGTDRATLLAICEGGPTSALLAADSPDRVERLVLYGTGARVLGDRGDRPPVSPGDLDRFFARLGAEWGGPAALELFAPSAAGDPRVRDWWARLLRAGTSPSAARRMLRTYRDLDVRAVLPRVRVPTLVVHRTGDRIATPAQAAEVAALIPGARRVKLPGADHLPMFGDATRLLDEVEEFATGVRSGDGLERAVATVLFTDIVGSTELAAGLGDRDWRDLLGEHDRRVQREVERRRGRVVKTTGDGVLATFDGPARAIAAAGAIRDAALDVGLRVRAGLHAGECETTPDGDVRGLAVHIAARVTASAAPGEVRLSRTVADLVAGSAVPLVGRGRHGLRGVPGEWELFALDAAA